MRPLGVLCLHKCLVCLSFFLNRKAEGRDMNATEKGNRLEDKLYDYLRDQIDRRSLVYDVYPPELCSLHKKKSYYCSERKDNVEFDVVVEVRRSGRDEPHIILVFECKNHDNAIKESYVRVFSDQLRTVFGHAAKGIIVTPKRLQSGAEKLAASRKLGIVKFDENGTETIADRKSSGWAEKGYIQSQLSAGGKRGKSLKFSAYLNEGYFSSFHHMLRGLETYSSSAERKITERRTICVPFLSAAEIKDSAAKARSRVVYEGGEVNVEALCSALSLNLSFLERVTYDSDGNTILGSANFANRSIDINQHGNRNRERFTVAHEIGHFFLNHDRYLFSESILENDLFLILIVMKLLTMNVSNIRRIYLLQSCSYPTPLFFLL